MTKSDLIDRISVTYPYMNLRNVERVISIILNAIVEQLASGGRVELRDFGSFSVKTRKSIEGRNPKSGEFVHIEERRVPYFKAGRRLKDLVNERVSIKDPQ